MASIGDGGTLTGCNSQVTSRNRPAVPLRARCFIRLTLVIHFACQGWGYIGMTRDNALAEAARNFKECEKRVARQKERLEKLEQGGHSDLAVEARSVLKLLDDGLTRARERLRTERRERGLPE